MDEVCVCLSKFDSSPAELIICPLHPCICLETQDINCGYCWSQIELMEEEDEQQTDLELNCYEESLDLTCYEDFETAVADPLEEVPDFSGKTQYQKYLLETQGWDKRWFDERPPSTLSDYLNLESTFETRGRSSTTDIGIYDYMFEEITFERTRRRRVSV